MYRYTKLSLLAVATTMTGAAAYAIKAHIQNSALVITQAKIPLIQTVVAVEQYTNGKVSRVEYEQSKQGRVYGVEVVSGTKVLDVRVDADRGTVISTVEDKADYDDVHDKQGRLRTATLGLCRG